MFKRLIGLATVAVLGTGPAAFSDPPSGLENFTLVDQAGATHELYGMADAQAIVIATQINGDPVSSETVKALEDLRGVFGQAQYLLLNSNASDTRAAIATEAAALKTTLPILSDDQQHVGARLGARQTGEAYIIDPIGWKIVYHGPVSVATASDPNEEFTLFNAMVYFMSHRPIDTPAVDVKGTPIPGS